MATIDEKYEDEGYRTMMKAFADSAATGDFILEATTPTPALTTAPAPTTAPALAPKLAPT